MTGVQTCALPISFTDPNDAAFGMGESAAEAAAEAKLPAAASVTEAKLAVMKSRRAVARFALSLSSIMVSPSLLLRLRTHRGSMAMPVERIGDSNAPFSLGRTISLRRLEVNRPKCTNSNFLTSNRSARKRDFDKLTDRAESRSGTG